MKNIHILPTDKPSRLQLTKNNKLFYSEFEKSYSDCSNKNIYITYDEKPKAGGWIENNGKIFNLDECKKIILTDNQYLIKDGVQAIDDEFLEWFVKNPSCEEVEVKKNYLVGYYLIIPKEEPKQETLEEAAKEYEEKDFITTTPTVENSQQMIQRAFTAGAKWQQERMYNLDFISKAKI